MRKAIIPTSPGCLVTGRLSAVFAERSGILAQTCKRAVTSEGVAVCIICYVRYQRPRRHHLHTYTPSYSAAILGLMAVPERCGSYYACSHCSLGKIRQQLQSKACNQQLSNVACDWRSSSKYAAVQRKCDLTKEVVAVLIVVLR